MKTKRPFKLLPVWLAISAAVIIAGIILMCILGFNTSPDREKSYLVEVRYDVSVQISPEKVEKLESICDGALGGVKVLDENEGYDSTLDMAYLSYTLPADTSAEALTSVQDKITADIAAAELLSGAEIRVESHAVESLGGLYYESIWRGAVALTVGVVVGLIYIGVRFGVGCAVTGLCLAAHDAAFTLSLFAITRIPTYFYAPLLFATIAAVFSLVFWLLHCMKLRDAKQDPALRSLDAADAVAYAWEGSWKKIVILAAAGIAIFAIAGGIAAAGVRLFLMPAVLPVAVAAYSSLLLGPSLHIPVKAAFDKFAAKHKPRYFGKKKAEKAAEAEADPSTPET